MSAGAAMSEPGDGATHAAAVPEARRLLALAAREQIPARVLGGVAIALALGDDLPPAFRREYRDIDFVVAREGGARLLALLERAGYEPDREFNQLHGATRLLLRDAARDRQVDVFVGEFRMCHAIPLEGRLEAVPETIPLAELLLTKLQIVRLNAKDRDDAIALLLAREVADHDRDAIDGDRVADLCRRDWGLHHTIELNLGRLAAQLAEAPLSAAQQAVVRARAEELLERMRRAPKTTGWRVRSRIGERVRWYEDPEEVDLEAR